MKIFKFGGASVRDADGIRNIASIVSKEGGKLGIVVSALGKTTNALEAVLKLWMDDNEAYRDGLDDIRRYHLQVINSLFSKGHEAENRFNASFDSLKKYLEKETRSAYDFEYDQIVSYGEIWSTIIVAAYLGCAGMDAEWVDIRKVIITDASYRFANVLWNRSLSLVAGAFDFNEKNIYVTQGFIGGTAEGKTTTLGREGSDFTAALLANMLDAECVVVWKDVPGLLNADPKWLTDAVKLEEVSYKEAVEMTFSGAKVIHPKTIKPLHNKNIPLYVKSFLHPEDKGTVVKALPVLNKVIPVFIKKEKQIMISAVPKDFSFAMGDNLGDFFSLLNAYGIKVNLVQASAVNINICADDDRVKIDRLLLDLKQKYDLYYNDNVGLFTIRHYTSEAIERITGGCTVLLEQKTRNTVRFVIKTTL